MTAIWTIEGPRQTEPAVLLDRLQAMVWRGRPACSPDMIAMLAAISRAILADPRTRQAPQYVALAYWLRRANLERLVASLSAQDRPGQMRTPRGLALHLPPTNVDTIFVYSWAMSVLAGNANVVRLPDTLGDATRSLVSLIATVVAEHGEQDRQMFCHYDYGDSLEQQLSALCDLRLVWGGDAKVNAVSRVPIRPDGLSIGFSDRKSLAVIGTAAYAGSDGQVRDALADRFFNDLYWFDQMGCGSPRLLVWVGEPADLANDFYGRLAATAARRDYQAQTSVVISKLVRSAELLATGTTDRHLRFGNQLNVSRAVDPDAALANSHGGGFLCDLVVASASDVADFAGRSLQTVTHYGLDEAMLQGLAARLRGRGGYRVVPIGEALQFDVVWDGLDLFETMTRQIVIRL